MSDEIRPFRRLPSLTLPIRLNLLKNKGVDETKRKGGLLIFSENTNKMIIIYKLTLIKHCSSPKQ